MERTTERFDGWVVRNGCRKSCYACNGVECAYIYHMIDRLAAYEDTMPLGRAQELAKAEKDGRLVVLPCNVGDKVYRVITTLDSAPVITEIEIKTLGQAVDLIGRIGEKRLLVSWYLTRKEAEAALKKREADNEAD